VPLEYRIRALTCGFRRDGVWAFRGHSIGTPLPVTRPRSVPTGEPAQDHHCVRLRGTPPPNPNEFRSHIDRVIPGTAEDANHAGAVTWGVPCAARTPDSSADLQFQTRWSHAEWRLRPRRTAENTGEADGGCNDRCTRRAPIADGGRCRSASGRCIRRRHKPMRTQHRQKQPGQSCQDRAVGPVHLRAGDLTPQHRRFMTQNHDLHVLVRLATRRRYQPAGRPGP
jgi:hypothetical protein